MMQKSLLQLPHFTIRELNRLLSSGFITSEQLYRYCHALAVAGEEQWRLNAFERFVPVEEALAQARQSDERRRQGKCLSVLDGIPISIKANIAVESLPLTAGSRILGATPQSSILVAASSPPPPPVGYNAAVSEALLVRSGCVLLGQTTMDEFGMGSLGTNTCGNKATKNPLPFLKGLKFFGNNSHNRLSDAQQVAKLISLPFEAILEAHAAASCCQVQEGEGVCDQDHSYSYYSAGGSSCGGAASVAHGSSILLIGTDTGGSVRLPAAWCGVVGWKPSYGVISRHGLVSYASSLDTVGFLAPSADCAGLAFRQVLRTQKTHQDSTISRRHCHRHRNPNDDFLLRDILETATTATRDTTTSEKQKPLEGFKVGIPAAFSVLECPASVREVWSETAKSLQQLGATVEVISADRISPRVLQRSLAAYYLLACAEASSNLARYDGFRYGVAAISSSSSSPLSSSSISDNLNNVAATADNDDEEVDDATGSSSFSSSLSLLSWSALERQYAASRTQGLGAEVVRRILCGTFVLSSDRFHTHYDAAAKLRAVVTQQLHNVLRTSETKDKNEIGENDSFSACYDLLLIPTAVTSPVSLAVVVVKEDKEKEEPGVVGAVEGRGVDPTAMLANDIMTVAISLAGLPALALPCGGGGPLSVKNEKNKTNSHEDDDKDNASIGSMDDSSLRGIFRPSLQLVGARHAEAKILRAAIALEEEEERKRRKSVL